MNSVFALVRALHFASLLTVFGASALLFSAKAIGVTGKSLWRLLLFAALGALIFAMLGHGFVVAEITGEPQSALSPTALIEVALGTHYGLFFIARCVLLLGLIFVSAAEGHYAFKTVLSGCALALLGFSSHAAAAGDPHYQLARAGFDALHLLGAGFWVGGLVVLVPEVLAKPRDTPRLVALLRLFSRWGAASVAVLIAAGTLNAIAILDVPGMRWSGTYVTWLAIKIVLAAVMVALALTNRFGVLPGMERGEAEASETIPLTVTAELGAALLILLIVGFLGITAPMEM